MTDAVGTYKFDIDLVYVRSHQLICCAALPTSSLATAYRFPISAPIFPPLVFPSPGCYEFRLRMDGQVIALKVFNFIQLPTPADN